MTRVSGVVVLAAPCCGRRYAIPRHLSMNFTAAEHWTDGWRENSLTPNDEGLRHCQCGQFVLTSGLVKVGTADSSNLPRLAHVTAGQLPLCIEQAPVTAVALAARLSLWRSLNHLYREQYRTHRDAEEQAIKTEWKAANPDRRSRWDRWRRRKPPAFVRPPDSPLTVPPFRPTAQQVLNMQRLTQGLLALPDETRFFHTLDLAELYREQGLFDEALRQISCLHPKDVDTTSRLIAELASEGKTAPVRYRFS